MTTLPTKSGVIAVTERYSVVYVMNGLPYYASHNNFVCYSLIGTITEYRSSCTSISRLTTWNGETMQYARDQLFLTMRLFCCCLNCCSSCDHRFFHLASGDFTVADPVYGPRRKSELSWALGKLPSTSADLPQKFEPLQRCILRVSLDSQQSIFSDQGQPRVSKSYFRSFGRDVLCLLYRYCLCCR